MRKFIFALCGLLLAACTAEKESSFCSPYYNVLGLIEKDTLSYTHKAFIGRGYYPTHILYMKGAPAKRVRLHLSDELNVNENFLIVPLL